MPSAEVDGVRCMWMRGGTSKGAFFLAEDLPADPTERDRLLLRIMGTPDPQQIDGIGGATSVTSKVAVVSASTDPDADVDYLFLQVGVDRPTVSDRQNCGNILAGVGPFAVERGLLATAGDRTTVRIRMVNSDSIAVATFPTPNGRPQYAGDARISGVPGSAAPISIAFRGTEGSVTGALFPTGRVVDEIDGVAVTCIDNGMPVVVLTAAALGRTGTETHEQLQADTALLERVDRIRCAAGELMGLGDVAASSVPKTMAVSPAVDGGHLRIQSFIPVTPHQAIGVLAAISAVTACRHPDSTTHDVARSWPVDSSTIDVEHPSGHMLLDVTAGMQEGIFTVQRSAVIRTARKLFDGTVFPTSTQSLPVPEETTHAAAP
ncbi:4-oxalomesaconate tautomerase [Flexivirga oryzae]|uniref:4-oxalomesaconate tautomerase n=1 Tax=Flexivirga oryzae TaxID=1794944 RepID=A0A839N6W5_9MICO|nr:4-oxalomesaconate tautomerase [Flexivirga oryzae]MBB2891843.1 4-oxalomesaconate tautomerase [Flexivirga oryzae]